MRSRWGVRSMIWTGSRLNASATISDPGFPVPRVGVRALCGFGRGPSTRKLAQFALLADAATVDGTGKLRFLHTGDLARSRLVRSIRKLRQPGAQPRQSTPPPKSRSG